MKIKEGIISCMENSGIFWNEKLDDNLANYGIDSFTFISLIIEIENKFNIIIPDEVLTVELFSSLNGFVALIEEIISTSKNPAGCITV